MQQVLNNSEQVGAILRSRRKSRRISQQTLAERLGFSQERLSALENAPAGLTLERFLALVQLLDLELIIKDKVKSKAPKAAW